MLFARLALRPIIPLLGLLCCGRLVGGEPVEVANFPERFDALVGRNEHLWLCRYAGESPEPPILRLAMMDGQAVSATDENLPAGTFQVSAAPDGTLYAVAYGGESGTNPSVWLWRRTESAWVTPGALRGTDSWEGVLGASVGFAKGRVLVALSVGWSSWGGGTVIVNGPPKPPPLAIFDSASGSLTQGPEGMLGVVGDGPVHGQQWNDSLFGWGWFMPRSVLTDDGLAWRTAVFPWSPINEVPALISLDRPLPRYVAGGRAFFANFLGIDENVSVVAEGGAAFSHPYPFSSHGLGPPTADTPPESRFNLPQTVDFVIARAGESFLGAFTQSSQTGQPDRHLLGWSDDYLQNFEFSIADDAGHIASAATDEGLYSLRATAEGTRLLRAPLPVERIPMAPLRTLSITSRRKAVPTGILHRRHPGDPGRDRLGTCGAGEPDARGLPTNRNIHRSRELDAPGLAGARGQCAGAVSPRRGP